MASYRELPVNNFKVLNTIISGNLRDFFNTFSGFAPLFKYRSEIVYNSKVKFHNQSSYKKLLNLKYCIHYFQCILF